ncbi:MAG: hypothetical protein M0018_03125 [Nitrospiraceae bacterium]|nr:hypothetical protein [Nitrospiraceae bacterium]
MRVRVVPWLFRREITEGFWVFSSYQIFNNREGAMLAYLSQGELAARVLVMHPSERKTGSMEKPPASGVM